MSLCSDHLTAMGAVGSLLLGLALGIVLAGVAMQIGGYLGRRSAERDAKEWTDRYDRWEERRDR